MKTYYITYSGNISPHNNVETWVIRNTENDMDTADGLLSEIKDIEKERGYHIRIEYWKELRTANNSLQSTGANCRACE